MKGPALSRAGLFWRVQGVVWGLLAVAGLLAFLVCGAVWDPAVRSLETFLFLVVGGGFTLVSVLDYIYERQAPERNE